MTRRALPYLVVFALTAAACGQKSGVAGTGGGGSGDGTTPPATQAPIVTAAPVTTPGATEPPASSTQPGDSTPASTTPGDSTPASTTHGDSTPASTTPGATTEPPVAVGPYEPGDNDTAGVTDTEIVIGIHAPVTGASPIPQESFDIGKDIYWRFLADNAPDRLFGRTVRVVFRDDEFDPQHAVQVCREMVEQDGAFLLVGGGGADQITACAKYADENDIPYLSAGVNETGLVDLATYFSTSLSYAEQAPLVIAQLQAQDIQQAALVVSDTPSFDDAKEAIEAAAADAGLELVYNKRINKNATPAEAATIAQELKTANAPAVILLSSPVVFVLGLAPGASNQGYDPLWIGPGVTSGLNGVTAVGCPAGSTDNAEFFSPTPGLDVIDELDPDYRTAYPAYADGADGDDIGMQLWSLAKAVALMFEATGPELGRAAFMNTLVTSGGFDNGIYAPLTYTVDDHLGGTGAHLLRADCTVNQYVTAEQFVMAGG
ncbi:MAG: ABC transporter substrate-binding protein [Acidimicrobiia bacterium]|nr:ABC transporter substrate-binding protein [Acidimicrobiia bacterium]